MAAISNEKLNDAITEFLKDADLKSVTTKKVRAQLEAKFKTSLLSRKKEIEEMIMKIISDSQDGSNNDDDDDDDDDEEDEKPKNKKASAPKRKAKNSSDDDDDDNDKDEEDDDKPSRTRGAPRKGGRKPAQKRKKGGGDDGDDEAKPKKKNSGFTKEVRLSSQLAEVMGQDKMARHEVVKKMWAVIGERDLKDPKDKRFTICDDQLLGLFGVKRFRTFSMLKYLTKHLLADK